LCAAQKALNYLAAQIRIGKAWRLVSNIVNPQGCVALAQALIRCPSVTPHEGGALALLEKTLKAMGFETHRLVFGAAPNGPVDNLFARLGTAHPHFCFAGHTDVVPPGPLEGWSVDPFAAIIQNDILIGRGANDMKSSIAAFVSAVQHFMRTDFNGSISFLITGDEEGPAQFGTAPVLEWMKAHNHLPDHCLVGEPTSAQTLGDMAKIGRRGSLNAHITVNGAQGHVAYPDRADNPLTKLVRALEVLKRAPLDAGTDDFQPSNLEITTIDVGNQTENMIPAHACARLNVRFNTLHSGVTLAQYIRETFNEHAPKADISIRVSGEAFLSPPSLLSDIVVSSIKTVTGLTPELSTTGGTSDARFISNYCPVIEFGLVGRTMHKADEQVPIADIMTLQTIYQHMLSSYFGHKS
jgi:succinyl-diaminopimelate desuccinylase